MCWPRAVTLLPRSFCLSKEGVAIFYFVYCGPLLFHRFAGFINPSVSRVHGSGCIDPRQMDCNPHPVPDGKGGCSHTNFIFSDVIQNLSLFLKFIYITFLLIYFIIWRKPSSCVNFLNTLFQTLTRFFSLQRKWYYWIYHNHYVLSNIFITGLHHLNHHINFH